MVQFRFNLVEVVRVVPLAGTPRSAIINGVLCRKLICKSGYTTAKRFALAKRLPPSTLPTTNFINKQKIPHAGVFLFVVEVVRVELTSYAAAKKLSTYLVYLLFLNSAGRVNTLHATQKAE